jgi:hypothetical protein
MPFSIRQAEYFTTSAQDQPGEAYKMLSALAHLDINLLAFTAVPTGTLTTQLTLFPEDPPAFTSAAKKAGLQVQGPHKAILVQGDDRLGAFAVVHEKLFAANVNVYASSGITDGRGSFGYLLYVRPEEFQRAVQALGL